MPITGDALGNLDTRYHKTSNNVTVGGYYVELDEISTPTTPAANKARLYAKDYDGESYLYFLSDTGSEYQIGGGGGGGVTIFTALTDTPSTYSGQSLKTVRVNEGETALEFYTPVDGVSSVFGRTGAVVAASDDYTWAQIDKTTSDIADITTKSHTSLSSIGTNTHAQIDTAVTNSTNHIAATTSIHGITDTLDLALLSGDLTQFSDYSHTLLTDIGTNTHAQVDTHLAAASPHSGHVDTSGDETVAGVKTFSSIPVLPASSPTADNQATRKAYVDSIAQGLEPKASCRCATTANIDLSQDLENGDTIDGITLATGDRILVKDQSTGTQNGIYDVPASGAASRSDDYNSSAEVQEGTYTYIVEGTANANKLFAQITKDPVLDTDALEFTQMGSSASYTASLGVELVGSDFRLDLLANGGLELTGNEVGVNVDDSSIEADGSGNLQVKALGITNAMLAGSIADTKLNQLTTANKVSSEAIAGIGALVQGDLIYGSDTDVLSLLNKNASATRYLSNTGTNNNPAWAQVNLANGVTGTLPDSNLDQLTTADKVSSTAIAGIGDLVQGDLVYGSGTDTLALLNKSASATRYLSNTGASNNPAWAQINLANGVTGELPNVNLATINTAGKLDGAALVNLDNTPTASQFPIAALATGTPDGTKFVRDDGTLAVPSGGGGGGVNAAIQAADVLNYWSQWRNMPSSTNEIFEDTEHRFKIDLTYATHYRIVVNMAIAAASGADLNLQYSTNGTDFSAADSGGAGECGIDSTGVTAGSWASLATGAKQDVWLRIVGKDGVGSQDPAFTIIQVQFKMLSTGGEAPADAEYVVLTANGTLSDERVLTAGEGIDITDGGAGSTVTVDGEDASDTNKGVASFGANDFDVSSGAVSLDYTNGQKASTTQAGFLTEIATAAETTTGTDATRAVSPDGLAGSDYGKREIHYQVLDGAATLTTGDGKAYFRMPASLNGMNIVAVAASVITKSTSGTPTVQIARGRQASATSAHSFVDVLSTAITIDVNEYDSKDAATAAVINGSNDDLATGDLLRIDCDVAGTGTKGLNVNITAQLP